MNGFMKQEDQGECSQSVQPYHDQQLFFHQHPAAAASDMFGGVAVAGGGGGLIFPDASPSMLPWSLPQVHAFSNPNNHFAGSGNRDHIDPFLLPPPPPSPYGSFFNRRAAAASSLQFAYDHGPSSSSEHHLRIITDALGVGVGVGSVSGHGAPFGLQSELGKMTAQEIMDAKALAASKSHSEAERRRRERINNHLAKLRSLLPSTTKTDKASLLAEVIQHVKELKRQTSLIAETSPIPTEVDEITVDPSDDDEEGRFVVKASLCCEDRTDLLPELIKTLKALRLRTLKAEITTLGGRVKNVLFITGDEDHSSNDGSSDHHHHHQQQEYLISSIQEALKAVMEKANGGGGGGGGGDDTSSASVKRQRTNNINNILEHRSL